MKLENIEVELEADESANWFKDDEIYYAQPEIFRLVEDGDIQGLNAYLKGEYMKQVGGF